MDTPIFVRYVSGGAAFGLDPTRWPPAFCDLLALRLAELCCGRLADPKMAEDLAKMRATAVATARAVEDETVTRVPPSQGTISRLQVCNEALAHLGLPRLPALTRVGSTTRALNDQWDGTLRWALERGPWDFASRAQAVQADATPPLDGYAYAVQKPADWRLRTLQTRVQQGTPYLSDAPQREARDGARSKVDSWNGARSEKAGRKGFQRLIRADERAHQDQ